MAKKWGGLNDEINERPKAITAEEEKTAKVIARSNGVIFEDTTEPVEI